MKIAILFVSALLFAGCGKGSDNSGLISEMESIKKDVCACPDMACVEKSKERMDKLEEKFEKAFKDESKAPKDMMEKLEKLTDEMGECVNKLENK